jgi:phosphate transport system substrate-binding protein
MSKQPLSYVVLALAVALAPACSKRRRAAESAPGASATGEAAEGGGIIAIDGSSTVYPITEAVAEEFRAENDARVTIGVSGTGGGFKKFCTGETAITGASRPIKPTEVEMCAKSSIDYVELPVAYDGLAIAVHKDNDWAQHITVEELKKLWQPEAQGKVTKWNQVRTDWPDKEIRLFGAGVDSGTYDYFTKAIVGKEHASRGDFTSSEDDNVLVQGIAGDKGALGFFGYAYYSQNADKLKAVPVDDGDAANGDGPISPSAETVANGTYQPLSRPIFIYVTQTAAKRPEVQAFIDFYLDEAASLVDEVGYIALPASAYELAKQRFAKRTLGSVFAGKGSKVGVTVEQLLEGQ